MILDYSVVIAAYNAEKTIRETLDSLKSQEILPREIILVDDASIDSTVNIGTEYGIRILKNKYNLGVGKSKKIGGFASRSYLTAFLDADDVWNPNAAKLILAAWERWLDIADLVGGQLMPMTGPAEHIYRTKVNRNSRKSEFLVSGRDLSIGNQFSASAIFLKTSTLESIGGWSENRTSDDYSTYLNMWSSGGNLINTPLVIGRYRLSYQSLSHHVLNQFEKELQNVEFLIKSDRFKNESSAKNPYNVLTRHWLKAIARCAHFKLNNSDIPELPKVIQGNLLCRLLSLSLKSKAIWRFVSFSWVTFTKFRSFLLHIWFLKRL